PTTLAVAEDRLSEEPGGWRQHAGTELDLVRVAAALGSGGLDLYQVVPLPGGTAALVRIDLVHGLVEAHDPDLVLPGGNHVEEEEPHPHGQTHAPVLRDLIQLLHAKEAADHVTEGL